MQRSHLNNISQSSRSLLRLINDILDLTKAEEGKMDIEVADFSLKAIALQLESAMCLLAQKNQLELHIHYPGHMPDYFQGDALRIVQILNNLVGNAIKFTERGGVYVDFDYDGETVKIHIVDTGIGMSPEQIEHLFEPFTQADASITRRFGGTGLGTTISNQLVQAMKGDLQVSSQLNVGSRFTISLPLPIGKEPKKYCPVAHSLPPMNVLIVDDIEQNLRLLQLLLENQQHTVETASNGQQAVEKYHATQGNYDMILMDMHMPGMDGLQATQVIRQHERQQNLPPMPIIALTASVMEEDRRRAQAAGMDGFATKPIENDQLCSEIARVLALQTSAPTSVAPIAEAPTLTPSTTQQPVLINWEAGSELWGGREAFEAELQRFFSQELSQLISLEEAQALDNEALLQYVHRLRGVAANLHLRAVSALTAQLEALLHQEHTEQALSRWQELYGAMQQTQQALLMEQTATAASAPTAEGKDVATSSTLDPSLLQQLHRSLERNEFNDQLIEQVCAQLNAEQAQQLQDAIDAFDFEAALALLHTLQENVH